MAQLAVIFLGFFTRAVFVKQLGVELVGVNAVLMSIVALLTFLDLGISWALMYALYKPLADNDAEKIVGIVEYAGRLFRWVSLAVCILGLAVLPFIDRFVKVDSRVPHLEQYYLVLLANTVFGYLMAHRIVLLNADQKVHVVQVFSLTFNVLRSIAQIVSLYFFASFFLFLCILVFFTLVNNVVVYVFVGRRYPVLRNKPTRLDLEERRTILASVGAMTVLRATGLAMNQVTPPLISVIVGTAVLGYYSNYLLVVTSAIMLTEAAFSALTPSVGNLIASKASNARLVFDEMVLLTNHIHGFIAVGILIFVDDFIALWLGREFLLPPYISWIMVLSFYISGTMMPFIAFRSATGLFKKAQWIVLTTAIVSVVLSVIFGLAWGLVGVLVAPIVARLLTIFWLEPVLLIRLHLRGSLAHYFGNQLLSFSFWLAIVVTLTAAHHVITPNHGLATVVNIVALALFVPVLLWLVFGRMKASRSLAERLLALFGSRIKNRTERSDPGQ